MYTTIYVAVNKFLDIFRGKGYYHFVHRNGRRVYRRDLSPRERVGR